jgi:ABC-type transporter Mla MlaB component
MPHHRPLTLDVRRLAAIDHTSAEMLNDWLQRRRAAGMNVSLAGSVRKLRGLTV